jgi:hypothetical protein
MKYLELRETIYDLERNDILARRHSAAMTGGRTFNFQPPTFNR